MTLYAIGDIQGCSEAFDVLLDALSFEPSKDRLWLVGDLVNRGPDSLGVLRRVMTLGDRVTVVLGNHDLHLLATAAGARDPSPRDTLDGVLTAPDAERIVDWLRGLPLMHFDAAARRVLVHAGIPPAWSLTEALERAREVESALRGPHWRETLKAMYGDKPSSWAEAADDGERRRFTINALTRMRYCDARGALDLKRTGPPGVQPPHLMPWFDVPGRAARDVHIVFGHWSALGLLQRDDVTGLDTGCVWGGTLSAIPLDPPGEVVSASCAGMRGTLAIE
jgi:bis(5'-nucleosyl)-tetraphosphatase (symmetrical)